MQTVDLKQRSPSSDRSDHREPAGAALSVDRCAIALAVGAVLATGPAWADCNNLASGTLTPNSGDTVTCSGASAVSVSSLVRTGTAPTVFSNSVSGVTVNNTGNLTPTTTLTAIALGAGTQITNDGAIITDGISDNLGAITLWGAGNRIVNRGTIEARNSEAIQGSVNNPYWSIATGVVIENSGVIKSSSNTSSPGTGVIKLGAGADITNSGEIRLLGIGGAVALQVSDGSRIENQASGLIRAEEIVDTSSGFGGGVNAVRSDGAATLVNAGRIEVIGDVNGPGRGVAVSLTGGGTIENTGTIDASRGGIAISAQAPVSLVNSGTIRGGTGNAISLANSEGSEVTLQTGSQITGTVSVRRRDTVLKTLQDWQAQFPTSPSQAQLAYDRCQQSANPSSGCYKSISALPQQAKLALEGTGSEDDRITGFNQIEKRGAGTWTLGTSLQAGSATDGYQSGDFRGPLNVDIQDAAGQLNLTGAITDNPDGTKGELVKNGAGVLALSGTNTYSGPTRINAGTLQANGGNGIGDNSAVTVAAGATLAVGGTPETIGSLAGGGSVSLQNNALRTGNDNTSTTFSGTIDGRGALVKIGTGTLRLSGTSTSTGSLSVFGGTLDVAGTVPMHATVRASATIIGTGTLGNLTNDGIVAPGNGPGTSLTVTGDYTQGATGILVINAEEQAGSGLTATRLNVGGSATFSSPPSTIDVKFDANAKIPALEGIIVVAADQGLKGTAPLVTLDPASLPNKQNFTLDLEATNLGGTYAKPGEAIPAGAGGAGFVVLQVKNLKKVPQTITAQYTVINGNYAVPPTPVIVAPPQVPQLVPPAIPTAVPMLAPALVIGPTANIATPVTPTTQSTGIVVQGGGVQIAGSTLVPTPTTPGGVPVGTATPVVTVIPPTDLGTSNFVSITGSYGTVDRSQAPPGVTYRLAYAPHQVTVYTTPTDYGNLAPLGVGLTSSESQVGSILTSLLPAPQARAATDLQATLVDRLYPLGVSQIPAALGSVSGEGTDPTFVTVMNSRLFQQAIETRLQDFRAGALAPVLASGATGGAAREGLSTSRNLWATATGSFGSGDYLQDADLTTGGFAVGADKDLGNGLAAGGALGYTATSVDPGPGGSANVASLELAGYGNWTGNGWYATALAGLGYHWLDMDRIVAVGAASEIAKSSADGWGAFAALTAGRPFALKGGGTLEPVAGLSYDHVWRDSFTETGTAFADRNVDGESLDAAQAFAGVRAYTEWALANGTRLRPELDVGYAREIGQTDIVSGATLTVAPASPFTVTTPGPGDNVGLVGVRLSGERPGGLSFFVDCHAELRSDYTGYVARAGVSVPF